MDDEDFDDFYDGDDEDWCDHDNPEVDILTGRATCWQCGATWFLSDAQLKREVELQIACVEAWTAPADTD